MGGQAKGAQCRARLRGRPESLRTRSTASVAGAHGWTDGSFLEMLFSRPSDAALSSPTAPSPLSSLRLFVVASGPKTIFKTVCRSVAPMRASGACTELRMGQLHGWPTGMSNLAGRTSQRWFRPRLSPGFPRLRNWHCYPPGCSSPNQGVVPDPVSSPLHVGGSLPSGTSCLLLALSQGAPVLGPLPSLTSSAPGELLVSLPASSHPRIHLPCTNSSANRSAALPGGFLLDLNRAQLSMAPGSHTLWSVPLRPQLFQLPVYS